MYLVRSFYHKYCGKCFPFGGSSSCWLLRMSARANLGELGYNIMSDRLRFLSLLALSEGPQTTSSSSSSSTRDVYMLCVKNLRANNFRLRLVRRNATVQILFDSGLKYRDNVV